MRHLLSLAMLATLASVATGDIHATWQSCIASTKIIQNGINDPDDTPGIAQATADSNYLSSTAEAEHYNTVGLVIAAATRVDATCSPSTQSANGGGQSEVAFTSDAPSPAPDTITVKWSFYVEGPNNGFEYQDSISAFGKTAQAYRVGNQIWIFHPDAPNGKWIVNKTGNHWKKEFTTTELMWSGSGTKWIHVYANSWADSQTSELFKFRTTCLITD